MASVRPYTAADGTVTWRVRYRDGSRQTSASFATKRDAEECASLIAILGATRAFAELDGRHRGGPTLDEIAERFFDWKTPDVTERTLADYRRDYANWIKPTLGHRQADAIDERDVQALVDHMAKRLDPKTVKDKAMVLSSIYRYASARSRRLVEHNPCGETELPKRKRKPVKGATITEWLALYAAARRTNADAADLLLFIISTGWRWSEASVLTVGSVEDYGDEMYVSRASGDAPQRHPAVRHHRGRGQVVRRVAPYPCRPPVRRHAAPPHGGPRTRRPRVHQRPRSALAPDQLPVPHVDGAAGRGGHRAPVHPARPTPHPRRAPRPRRCVPG